VDRNYAQIIEGKSDKSACGEEKEVHGYVDVELLSVYEFNPA